ncbi:MAG: phenylalanine--tRNA ligase subunit beta [Verrucomicrobiota bacterium]
MKICLNWLEEYCSWSWSLSELVEKLTMSGTEVEAVHETGFSIDHIVTAKVLSFKQHPNADRLRLCQVDDGQEVRQIVCGASNFKEGDMVPLALPGAVIPASEKFSKPFTIKKSKLRGEVSEGMMCAGSEIGLSDDAEGLLILDSETKVGQSMKDLYLGDTVLELEVTPNRSDLLSYIGVSRELIACGARKRDYAKPQVEPLVKSGSRLIDVQDKQGCPRYTAVEINGVHIGPSPEWMKQRLESIGLRPVNNIVDITNYVLFEYGQPLHAFDADKLADEKIIVRRAKEAEKFEALDHESYELNQEDLTIADSNGVIALAGVMGGLLSSVTDSTTRILLESAQFEPKTVRRTSRRLALISDSSYRFERGVDPQGVDWARERAVELILEIAGGEVVHKSIESSAAVDRLSEIHMDHQRAEALLGYQVSEVRVKEIFEALGLKSLDQGNWAIPSFRVDLSREIDLIEEIARVEGLARVPSRLKIAVSNSSDADRKYDREMLLRYELAGLGYHEISNYSLLSLQEEDQGSAVSLHNPLNSDLGDFRSNLLESALTVIKMNIDKGNQDLHLFEIGSVCLSRGGHFREERHLLLIATGKERLNSWEEEGKLVSHYSLKGILEHLALSFPEIKVPKDFGLVDRSLLKRFNIKQKVYAVELKINHSKGYKQKSFQPLPSYPSVSRDLAFEVERSVRQQDIFRAIEKVNIQELESVKCFDLFQDDSGDKLHASKKSLAYAFIYRSKDKTLTDKDVSKWEDKIVASVLSSTGGKLRS